MTMNRRTALQILVGLPLNFGSSVRAQTSPKPLYKQRRVGLVVANSNYEHLSKLKGAPVDAETVSKALSALAFNPVIQMADASMEQLQTALWKFKVLSRSADFAFLYYAGHAVEFGGMNYLLPVESDISEFEAVQYLGIPVSFAIGAVANAKTLAFMSLDACRDDPFLTSLKIPGELKHYERGLAPVANNKASNLIVQYSTALGEVAADAPQGSYYAKALAANLSYPGLPVMKVVQQVARDVADSTKKAQRPYFTGTIAEDIYFIAPQSKPVPQAASPIVVDFEVAENKDETIRQVVDEGDNRYDYVLEDGPGNGKKLYPKLGLFNVGPSGRAFIEGEMNGYFSPEEGAGILGVSYPILDVVARRATNSVVTLASVILDVAESKPDVTPYVHVSSGSDVFGKVDIVNEGWSNIRRLELRYDIIPPENSDVADVEAMFKDSSESRFPFSVSATNIREHVALSLEKGLRERLAGFDYYRFAFSHSPYPQDDKAKFRVGSGAPKGYRQWLEKHPAIYDLSRRGPNEELSALMVGKLKVYADSANDQSTTFDVSCPVPIYAPEGLGGGAIQYNLKQKLSLRTRGAAYRVSKSIGYLLDRDTKTFRGLFPLVADRTSDHRFRVILVGDGGQELYVSPSIEAKIFVPKASKKYVSVDPKR